jgi:hypothetical protein
MLVGTANKYGSHPSITIVASEAHYWAKPLPTEKILDTLSDPTLWNFG